LEKPFKLIKANPRKGITVEVKCFWRQSERVEMIGQHVKKILNPYNTEDCTSHS
jgi:hypothetical protein